MIFQVSLWNNWIRGDELGDITPNCILSKNVIIWRCLLLIFHPTIPNYNIYHLIMVFTLINNYLLTNSTIIEARDADHNSSSWRPESLQVVTGSLTRSHACKKSWKQQGHLFEVGSMAKVIECHKQIIICFIKIWFLIILHFSILQFNTLYN